MGERLHGPSSDVGHFSPIVTIRPKPHGNLDDVQDAAGEDGPETDGDDGHVAGGEQPERGEDDAGATQESYWK